MVKRCRSSYWMTAGRFDFIVRCERRGGHKGSHKGIIPQRGLARRHLRPGFVEWDVGGPPKCLDTKPDPKVFDVDDLVRELNEESRVEKKVAKKKDQAPAQGCVHYTKERCLRHPRYKVLRKPTADCSLCRLLWGLKELERLLKKADRLLAKS